MPTTAHQKTVPPTSGIPRYLSLANSLTEAIAEGHYPLGSTLPTEHELCDKYGVSRFTVREALRQLRAAGLVTRRPRAGTQVVSTRQITPYTQALGSIDDLLQYAADTELRLNKIGKIRVDAALAQQIPMPTGETWFFASGMRYTRGLDLPVCLTRVYINPVFGDVGQRLRNRSDAIYKVLEKEYGANVLSVEQRVFATALSRADARALKASFNAPALRTVRLYYGPGQQLLEASDSVHPGDRFSYTMKIDKSP